MSAACRESPLTCDLFLSTVRDPQPDAGRLIATAPRLRPKSPTMQPTLRPSSNLQRGFQPSQDHSANRRKSASGAPANSAQFFACAHQWRHVRISPRMRRASESIARGWKALCRRSSAETFAESFWCPTLKIFEIYITTLTALKSAGAKIAVYTSCDRLLHPRQDGAGRLWRRAGQIVRGL